MHEMLRTAVKENYAVGQFNLNNLEFTQAILQAAQKEKSPLICGVSEGAAKYMGGYQLVVDMVKALMATMDITVPVALHLDHGSSFESCLKAIYAGFTSVMIDGSHLPLAENIILTQKVVEICKPLGISVEGELGRIGGTEDDLIVKDAEKAYAITQECEQYVKETGVDCFAPALGSVHGLYKGEPNLNFARMAEIKEITKVPLVLHGGTGIPHADILKAIERGTAKINVNTENQITFTAKIKQVFDEKPKLYDPRKYLGPAREDVEKIVRQKISEFGSKNKA